MWSSPRHRAGRGDHNWRLGVLGRNFFQAPPYAQRVARLRIEGDDLAVRLSFREHIYAFHGDVVVPLSVIRSVSLPRMIWTDLRGWRSSGLTIPGKLAYGTRRHGVGYDFCAIRRLEPTVQIDLIGQRYDYLIVSTPDADHAAAQIAAAAGVPLAD